MQKQINYLCSIGNNKQIETDFLKQQQQKKQQKANIQKLLNTEIQKHNKIKTTETETTTIKFKPTTETETINNIEIPNKVFSYNQNFNSVLKDILTETDLKVYENLSILFKQKTNNNIIKPYLKSKIDFIKKNKYCINRNNYIPKIKDIVTTEISKHSLNLLRFLNNTTTEYKKQYKNIVTTETENNKNKNINFYIYSQNLKDIRKQKQQLQNKIKKSFKYYNQNLKIIRQQNFLKSINMHQQKGYIFFSLNFNLKNKYSNKQYKQKQNSINQYIELPLKYDNETQNKSFNNNLKRLKETLKHIKIHNKNNRKLLNKIGYIKSLKVITKNFLRYNKNNNNIKILPQFIYLYIVKYNLLNTTENTINHINKFIKENKNIKTEHIHKQKAYTTETTNKPFITILLKNKQNIKNNVSIETINKHKQYKPLKSYNMVFKNKVNYNKTTEKQYLKNIENFGLFLDQQQKTNSFFK